MPGGSTVKRRAAGNDNKGADLETAPLGRRGICICGCWLPILARHLLNRLSGVDHLHPAVVVGVVVALKE